MAKGEFATKLWPSKVLNYKFLFLKPYLVKNPSLANR